MTVMQLQHDANADSNENRASLIYSTACLSVSVTTEGSNREHAEYWIMAYVSPHPPPMCCIVY